MDMQGALRARLVAAAGVTAIVAQRVYWLRAPQGAELPRITLGTISDGREQDFAGFLTLQSTRVQVDCWGRGYGEARTMAEAVIATLCVPETSNGVTFARAFVASERDLDEVTDTEEIHRISIDLIMWWRAA